MTVTSALGKEATARIVDRASERLGLRANEVVDVAVKYGVEKSGTAIAAVPLDGGRVVGAVGKLTVAADGVLRFKFLAGGEVGTYQVSLYDGAREMALQFWVLDEADPRRNPRVVTPAN